MVVGREKSRPPDISNHMKIKFKEVPKGKKK